MSYLAPPFRPDDFFQNRNRCGYFLGKMNFCIHNNSIKYTKNVKIINNGENKKT
jgi:hypothetical protein